MQRKSSANMYIFSHKSLPECVTAVDWPSIHQLPWYANANKCIYIAHASQPIRGIIRKFYHRTVCVWLYATATDKICVLWKYLFLILIAYRHIRATYTLKPNPSCPYYDISRLAFNTHKFSWIKKYGDVLVHVCIYRSSPQYIWILFDFSIY